MGQARPSRHSEVRAERLRGWSTLTVAYDQGLDNLSLWSLGRKDLYSDTMRKLVEVGLWEGGSLYWGS